MARFVAAAEALTIGDLFAAETTFSSLTSLRHFEKVSSYVGGVAGDGGKVLTGGVDEGGRWLVRPTVVVDLPLTAGVLRGNLRTRVRGEPLRVRGRGRRPGQRNDTRYGLNAMLFTENLSRAHRVASRLRAGTVWVNCLFIGDLRAPFGGVGYSGLRREGGNFSREFFTEPKAVVMQIQR